jgi:hypothetical protein
MLAAIDRIVFLVCPGYRIFRGIDRDVAPSGAPTVLQPERGTTSKLLEFLLYRY